MMIKVKIMSVHLDTEYIIRMLTDVSLSLLCHPNVELIESKFGQLVLLYLNLCLDENLLH